MGINGFGNFYKNSCSREKEVNNFLGDVLIVDAIYQLFRYAIAYRKRGTDMCNQEGKRIIHLWALMQYTLYLLRMGINPFYVFDGKAPDLKKETIDARIMNKSKALLNLINLGEDKENKEYIKFFKRTYSLTNQEIRECIELLNYMGIPNVRASGEADVYCAALSKCEKFDGVISNDTDLLVFGAKKLLKNFSGKKNVEEITLQDIYDYTKFKANEILLAHHKNLINDNFITHEMFIDFSILLGSDYTPHIKGFSSDQLFEYFVLNDFNIEKTIEALNSYIINTPKSRHDYMVPVNFLDKAKEAKEYYLKSNNVDINVKHLPSEPEKEKLFNFLCTKNGFDEESVTNFINELQKLYYTMNAFNNKKNDPSFKSFRGYQFKYFTTKYNPKYNQNLNKNKNNNNKFIKENHKEFKKNFYQVKQNYHNTNYDNMGKKNNCTGNRFSFLSYSDA